MAARRILPLDVLVGRALGFAIQAVFLLLAAPLLLPVLLVARARSQGRPKAERLDPRCSSASLPLP